MRSTVLACSLALLAAAPGCGRPAERWNVLWITIDTLRADHLGCYGYGKPTSPELDRLAAEGLRFAAASSPRAKTTPAVASLFTGLYPHDHGVRDLVQPLAADVPVLAERLRDAGWRTGAIVGNWVLTNQRSGLRRGFDLWEEFLPDLEGVPPDDVPQRDAASLTDGALLMLDLADATGGVDPHLSVRQQGVPWFLWLHYMDPHGAYDPPPEHRVFHSPPELVPPLPAGAKPARARHVAEYNVPAEARAADGAFDAAAVRDLYDGEIRYLDAQIGRLLAALRDRGLLERTLVVITADHGESLGEHDYWFEHGLYVYESTCRVPLIVRFPDAWPGRPQPGVRAGDVSLVDLAPTLLEWCGLAPLPARNERTGRTGDAPRGAARLAQWLADDGGEHPVFYEKVERADEARTVQTKAVRIGPWKLVRRFAHVDKGGKRSLAVLSDELYDLRSDPLEARDLAAERPAAAPWTKLNAELNAFTAADVHFADVAELLRKRREELQKTDPEDLRILEALGY